MSICEEAPASALAGRESYARRLRPSVLANLVVSLFSGWRNRRLVVSMRDFDDAQLADIGLSRYDVETALRNPGLDPTLHLIHARKNPLRGTRRS